MLTRVRVLMPPCIERLVERDVGIADLHVLADHADVDHGLGVLLGATTARQSDRSVGGASKRSLSTHDVVQILLVQQHRNLVDVVGIDRRYHGALLDVGEQRDLAPLLVRQGASGSGTTGCPAGCRCRAVP